ncbi:uncharacterized protein F4807DRAFT_458710 [Annulohypoxylon truncatum]|uniref:uncharacterized protein n=1 Tax=Annulohypoxylon truncatum TaxID=327061 RepID=UPI0020089444|nr:uncharacterized protein F4807DRAFT_458710 [Annulohypoxylon truncatum]KAI1211137.1 hypothetical protein F4807DRAFT_458710 [Annulohypoxylon truncatum]
MSEYWKSTPKYWCKHCSIYVRDTKFERQNHEATAKHQGALKRFLRDLHRNHEQDQREKERAKREVERLNGVVSSASAANVASTSKASAGGSVPAPPQPRADGSQRQKQWEQLAEMGIDFPTELRREMAMAGEWTVTNTRIIQDTSNADDPDSKPGNVDAIASGVRKRPKPEEEEEEEENAIKGLFKKPKKWGRDTKHVPESDAELDALLNRTLTNPSKVEEKSENTPKEEDLPSVKKEDPSLGIKKETDEDTPLSDIKPTAVEHVEGASVKQEENAEGDAPTVIFKKRKPKNIRQR